MLTLGWSDGYTFMPVDFSLLSSIKSQLMAFWKGLTSELAAINAAKSFVARTSIIPAMINRALSDGMQLLMCSWTVGLHMRHLSKRLLITV